VLIKQMADIRAGLRDNPTMYPFAATLTDPQELADVAAYIESLCIPTDHGKYSKPGDNTDKTAADTADRQGKALYEKQCLECHGKNGEGNKEKFYPVIAGQHYKYLLRQMTEIRDGHRRNANPDMVKVIKPYTNDQLVAISAYQSSLVMPGAMCKPRLAQRRRSKLSSMATVRPPPGGRSLPRHLRMSLPNTETQRVATWKSRTESLPASPDFAGGLVAAYFAPIWWVSLTAPNYPPKDAFPDGIRIHFHFDGVYNGCKAAGKGTRMANEIIQKDLAHDDERYNPITDAKKERRQGRRGPRLRS
jgi:cytochrome c553